MFQMFQRVVKGFAGMEKGLRGDSAAFQESSVEVQEILGWLFIIMRKITNKACRANDLQSREFLKIYIIPWT